MIPLLSNLLFSLNMCLPIFILLFIGWFLTHKGIFTQDFLDRASSLVYYVLLPANLFLDMCDVDLGLAFAPRYAGAALVCLVVQLAMCWLAGNLLCKDPGKQSAVIHGSFRGNFAYMGLPLLQNIFGDSIPSVAMVFAVVLPIYAVQGVVLMRVKESRGKIQPLQILLDVLKNPMILAILAGLLFSWLQLSLPGSVFKSLGMLQSACSPLALLVVGGSIQLDALRGNFSLVCKATAMKLAILPFLWYGVSVLFGLSAEQTVTMTLLSAMPSAVNSYIVTQKMGGNGDVASGIVVFTHLCSLFTLTLVIFFLRSTSLL